MEYNNVKSQALALHNLFPAHMVIAMHFCFGKNHEQIHFVSS